MRAPGFWWRPRPSPAARLLQPLGALYGAMTLRRMAQPGLDAGLPVICVGNFVAGGAGKTPTTLTLAGMLGTMGLAPAVLTRGYGGRLPGPVRVDPAVHGAADVGDEALLMAARVPTVVARDRPAGAALARRIGADVVVMDDGLQNPSLRKDLRLAVVDGESGVGNGLCLPAGPLRAPLAAQMRFVNAIVIVGAGTGADPVRAEAARRGLPALDAGVVPEPAALARLAGKRLLAVAGIGRPEKFAAMLRRHGLDVAAERPFADHHAYMAADAAALAAQAQEAGLTVATTEKDAVKLAPLWPAQGGAGLVAVPITLAFEAPERVARLFAAAIAR